MHHKFMMHFPKEIILEILSKLPLKEFIRILFCLSRNFRDDSAVFLKRYGKYELVQILCWAHGKDNMEIFNYLLRWEGSSRANGSLERIDPSNINTIPLLDTLYSSHLKVTIYKDADYAFSRCDSVT